jgi:hypothetical protein
VKLKPSLVKVLSQIDDVKSACSVLQTVGLAGISVSVPLVLGMSPWFVLPSIVFTASRQQVSGLKNESLRHSKCRSGFNKGNYLDD